MLGNQDEKNDCGSEDVDMLALVRGLQVDLRSHVVQGAQLGMQVALSILSIGWSSKTEIGNLQVEVFVQ